ncbi:MAG TPA: VOC family protein [Candidatus Binatia bacterium]|jgi:extradiol dioxygenase family protein|nr:VOC family protein [Candidatus Binatia bacterium]
MRPVFHLAFPVSSLAESERFYVTTLGATAGRRSRTSLDLLLFGHQLTIHERPAEVLTPEQTGVRHFGVILGWDEWDILCARLREEGVQFVREPSVVHQGTPREEGKMLLLDPSGNLIELKTYRDPRAALGLDV